MKLDAAATRHLMSVLTSLYSNPQDTVIREYSTNARDSHIMAGQTRPFEVFTPSALSPYFKVKDYGLGLSVEEVREVFSLYGASTKRDTNAVAGMLGLGSKSALAYTESFTVVAVKDGIKAYVNVFRKEDGTGVMEIVDESKTDEPNGVEVIIPVKHGNTFERSTKRFFQYWEKGLVLVNGADVSRRDELMEVTPGIFVDTPPNFDWYRDNHSYVMMGGVTYPVDNNYSIGRSVSRGHMTSVVVAEVPIGELDFTPSREQLMYTARTKNWLANIETQYTEHIKAAVFKEIEDAPDAATALSLYKAAKQKYSFGMTVTWKGNAFPQDHDRVPGNFMIRDKSSYSRRYSYANYDGIHLDGILRHKYVFENYDGDRPKPREMEKVTYYFDTNHLDNPPLTHTMFCRGPLDLSSNVWVGAINVIDWQDIKAVKLPSKPRQPVNRKSLYSEEYEVWDTAGMWTSQTIKQKQKFIYFTPGDEEERMQHPNSLIGILPNTMIVRVYGNRVEKLKRLYPNARPFREAVQEFWDNYKASLTPHDKYFILNNDYYSGNTWESLSKHISRIEDPDVVSLAQAYKNRNTQQTVLGNMDFIARRYNSPQFFSSTLKRELEKHGVKNPLERYPLFNRSHLSESIEYMNLKYRALQAAIAAV